MLLVTRDSPIKFWPKQQLTQHHHHGLPPPSAHPVARNQVCDPDVSVRRGEERNASSRRQGNCCPLVLGPRSTGTPLLGFRRGAPRQPLSSNHCTAALTGYAPGHLRQGRRCVRAASTDSAQFGSCGTGTTDHAAALHQSRYAPPQFFDCQAAIITRTLEATTRICAAPRNAITT